MMDDPFEVAAPVPSVPDAVAELVAARESLGEEIIRLEATARAAVDVRAKVRRNPGKTAAVVGGTAFLAVKGPRRVFRTVKRRIVGAPDPLPQSLLPDQVEQAIRALGEDGAKVRGALERDFAAYVDANRKGESRFLRRILLTGGVPLAGEVSRMLLKRIFEPSAEDVSTRDAQVRFRLGGKGPDSPTR